MIKKTYCLCVGRHEMPTDQSIFGQNVDPTDVEGLQRQALEVLQPLKGGLLDLYVTGLTVALIACLNACRELKIGVTLWHYDRETGKYYPQDVA